MHVRITTISGATHIDAGLQHLREAVVPQLKQQKGYRGLTTSGDPAAGIISVLTLWNTRPDLDASESAADKLRSETVAAFGGDSPTIERYEQVVQEVGLEQPAVGSRLQIRWVKMDPALVEDNIAFFKSSVAPEIMSAPGFQGLRLLINPATGEGATGIVYRDQEALQAANAQMEQRRSRAASRGVEFGDVAEYEALFAAL